MVVSETVSEDAVAQLAATHLGIDVSKLPAPIFQSLVTTLPRPLHDNPKVLTQLKMACSIAETFLMRRPEHFDVLKELLHTLPAFEKRAPLRIWCAGCASGEEAYSVAAVLRHLTPWGLTVVGSDLCEHLIQQARTGQYSLWSLRNMDPNDLGDWLLVDGLKVYVSQDIKSSVQFHVHNLAEDPYPGDFDVIFCRNVLLYFHEQAARVVFERFARALRPSGALFISDFDPRPELTSLWSEECLRDVFYFRRTADRFAKLDVHQEPPRSTRREMKHADESAGDTFSQTLDEIRCLLDQHAFAQADLRLGQVIEQDPLSVQAHVLNCISASEQNRHDLALASARRVCFLAPNEPMSHYLMGSCLYEVREPHQAYRHLQVALRLLSSQTHLETPLVLGEGLTGRQLKRIIHGYTARKQ